MSHARYETKQECGADICWWEITQFEEGTGFKMKDGMITVKTAGFYSIVAQLHNKKGNKWIGTNLIINGKIKSRCEGKYSALVSYTGYLKKNDSIWISKRGSNISNGDNCDGSCQVFNYLEIMLYTF